MTSVSAWQETLKKEALVFENIGAITLDEKQQYIFEPQKDHNFLTDSFGLIDGVLTRNSALPEW